MPVELFAESINVIVLMLMLPELSEREDVVILVSPEPSPKNLPLILPDEIVEKNP